MRQEPGHGRRGWAPWFVLIIAMGLTAVATALTADSVAARSRARFENAIQATTDSIHDRLDIYTALLRGAAGLFAVNDKVSFRQFRDYVTKLELRENYPGIQGIGFARRIDPEDLDAVAEELKDTYPDFHVWPDTPRDLYTAITYLEPLDERNRAAIGYDMYTEPARAAAMARARDTGLPAATGRVTLVQEITPDVQAGFLIYFPLYEGGVVPGTVAERRDKLRGYIYSPFRAGDLLSSIYGSEVLPRVHVQIYDGPAVAPEALLYRSDEPRDPSRTPRMTRTLAFEVAGRPWTVVVSSRPAYESLTDQALVPILAGTGLVLSMILFGVTRSLTNARAAAEERAMELRRSERALRDSELRFRLLFEQSPLTIQILRADGQTTAVNDAWCRLWKADRAAALSYNILQDEQLRRKGALDGIQRAFAGESVSLPPVRYDPDEIGQPGRPRWVEIFAYPLRGEPDEPVGEIILMIEDVTERTEAEEAMRRSGQRYRSLVDATSQIVWTTDAAGNVVEDLPAWRIFTGQSVEQVMGRGWMAAVHPDDVQRAGVVWGESLRTRTPHEQEFRVRRHDGAWRDIFARAVPVMGRDGELAEWVGTCTDITDTKRNRLALESSERRFRNLFDSNIVGVAFWQFDGTITQSNDYLLNLFEFTREDLPRRAMNWRDLTPPEYVAFDDRAMSQIIATGTADPFEKELTTKSGQRVAVLVAAAVVAGSTNEGMSFVLDVTQRRRAEEELKRAIQQAEAARQEAETANRLKDEFLATVSHELRTPLNAILGWAQMLTTEPPTEEDLAHGLETIERNARAQAQLVEDLLDVSRIISGRLRLDVQAVDPAPVIEAAAESVRPSADAKQIALNLHLERNVGPLNADPHRLQQMVWNLLSNATKFTPAGGQIDVTLKREDGQAVIRVTDNGMGISPQFLPHVFERFRQADASSTRKHGGLGLGLGIVRHLTELHGGTVEADSDGEGAGATFTICLPIPAVRTAQENGQSHAEQPGPSVRPILADVDVLVVDDNPDALKLLARVLRNASARVTSATGATEALDAYFQHRPDVLISDIAMPGHDGYWLIQRIRANETPDGGRHLPAIALTAYARAEDARRATAAGYDLHIPKPVEPTRLMDAVVSLVSGASAKE